MNKPRRCPRLALAAALAAGSLLGNSAVGPALALRSTASRTDAAAAKLQAPSAQAILPKAGQAGPWGPSSPPETYLKESHYGYIDGGAELVLPYGFEEAAVGRYAPAGGGGREITVEVYKTATPLDAFGLFSVQRDGREDVSPAISSAHWLSPDQASLAKGSYYVNLVGFETTAADLEAMLKAVEARIPGPAAAALDPWFAVLPAEGRAPRSERFIKGEGAARAETQFFSEPAWGFGRGTKAVSARYAPGEAKLIVILAAGDAEELDKAARDQFAANLDRMKDEGGRLTARNAAGQGFAYARRGRTAFLAWGRGEAAAALLALAAR
jgi:hypothetical protein